MSEDRGHYVFWRPASPRPDSAQQPILPELPLEGAVPDAEGFRGLALIAAPARRVLTNTGQPNLHRHPTTRDRAANLRLFRLVSEILHAMKAGVFHPAIGWQCQDCPYRSRCWAWG